MRIINKYILIALFTLLLSFSYESQAIDFNGKLAYNSKSNAFSNLSSSAPKSKRIQGRTGIYAGNGGYNAGYKPYAAPGSIQDVCGNANGEGDPNKVATSFNDQDYETLANQMVGGDCAGMMMKSLGQMKDVAISTVKNLEKVITKFNNCKEEAIQCITTGVQIITTTYQNLCTIKDTIETLSGGEDTFNLPSTANLKKPLNGLLKCPGEEAEEA